MVTWVGLAGPLVLVLWVKDWEFGPHEGKVFLGDVLEVNDIWA